MVKTSFSTNGHRERTLVWGGHAIKLARPSNRDRERARKLGGRLVMLNQGYTAATLNEFAAAVIYTVSGDEFLWQRPDPDAPDAELLAAMEHWLDVESDYIDQFYLALDSKPNPVTGPTKLSESDDPNA